MKDLLQEIFSYFRTFRRGCFPIFLAAVCEYLPYANLKDTSTKEYLQSVFNNDAAFLNFCTCVAPPKWKPSYDATYYTMLNNNLSPQESLQSNVAVFNLQLGILPGILFHYINYRDHGAPLPPAASCIRGDLIKTLTTPRPKNQLANLSSTVKINPWRES